MTRRSQWSRAACLASLLIVCASTIANAADTEATNACANKNAVDLYALAFTADPAPTPAPSTPDNENSSAASASGVGTSLVDSAERPRVIALAMDAGLLSESEGATTLTVTPFAWVAFSDPDVLKHQAAYEQHQFARRFAGKVTWGGKGDAFDRDGDGTVDEAVSTTSASDMVTYEASYRFYGTRDRRDEENYASYFTEIEASNTAYQDALGTLAIDFARHVGDLRPDESAAECEALLQRLRAGSKDHAAALAAHEERLLAIANDWTRRSEGRLVMSLVASGTERDEKFGGDKRAFGLRATKGNPDPKKGGSTLNFSLDYLQTELPNGHDELEGLKLGYEYNRLYSEFPMFGWKNATLSLGITAEKYSDVPAGMADSIAKAGAKVTFKVGENVKIPISLTWANRTDLLEDETEVIAHIGLSYDLDTFLGR